MYVIMHQFHVQCVYGLNSSLYTGFWKEHLSSYH